MVTIEKVVMSDERRMELRVWENLQAVVGLYKTSGTNSCK